MLTEKRVKTMAEYIDEYIRKNDVYNLKNAFSSLIKEESTKHDGIEWVIYNRASESALNMIERGVQEIPAADVVEVVRCQNCAYSHKGCDSDMTKEIWCTYWQKTEGKAWNMMHFDDFCSHGAKMDLEESK